MDLVVADQFREGNTPAIQEPLAVARRAFEALPETVNERYFRGDSACYETELLDWLRDENRESGPQGRIGFAVSAPMMKPLKDALLQLESYDWQPYREDAEALWDCAVVDYSPQEKGRREPLRYLAIRVTKKQGELFADGSEAKHYAVATNLWDGEPQRLLEWHREKAGSIEALHDVLKNELAAGVLPCGLFGANAAWLRLSALTHNVLGAMKRLALPPELLRARPKRLRFLVFAQPGKFVRHARQLTLRRLGRSCVRIRPATAPPSLTPPPAPLSAASRPPATRETPSSPQPARPYRRITVLFESTSAPLHLWYPNRLQLRAFPPGSRSAMSNAAPLFGPPVHRASTGYQR